MSADLWVWEGPDGEPISGEIQVVRQTYNGDSWHMDGSVSSVRGRRLANGSWFEIHYWCPAR